jgi:hypothetical protein
MKRFAGPLVAKYSDKQVVAVPVIDHRQSRVTSVVVMRGEPTAAHI